MSGNANRSIDVRPESFGYRTRGVARHMSTTQVTTRARVLGNPRFPIDEDPHLLPGAAPVIAIAGFTRLEIDYLCLSHNNPPYDLEGISDHNIKETSL